MNSFRNILFIFPVMIYYILEALIVGLFITIVWNLFLNQYFGSAAYLQIVSMYWIVKMLFFNVFNLVNGLNMGQTIRDEIDKREEE